MRGNAARAVERLLRAGPEVIPALQFALHSDDWQQRQMAGQILLGRGEVVATRSLAAVLVEALRDDDLPVGPVRVEGWDEPGKAFTPVENLAGAMRAFDADPELFRLAEPELVAALGSDDTQQRLAAALVLAHGGPSAALARTCWALIEHLRDNDIRGDAARGLEGLAALGPAAMPYVEAALARADPQQAALLSHWLGHFAPSHRAARRLTHEELRRQFGMRMDHCLLSSP